MMIMKSNHAYKCDKEQCLYYKQLGSSKKSHFLWIIVIFTIIVIGVFIFHTLHYLNNQEKIISLHDDYCTEIKNTINNGIVVKDSLYFINDVVLENLHESQQNISQLLELQFNKLQSDFTVLSLWSSVLMIVFLIFSIYSVFKIDALMKQSRDALQHADDAASKVDNKIQDIMSHLESEREKAVDDLKGKTNDELDKIQGKIDEITKSFKTIVDKKASEFEEKYQKYVDELAKSSEANKTFVDLIVNTITSYKSESKTSKNQ